MRYLKIFLFVILLSLTSCGGSGDIEDYSYNLTYGMACGEMIGVDGNSWRDRNAVVAMFGSIVPISEIIIENQIKDVSEDKAVKLVMLSEESKMKAINEIRKNGKPDIKQCIKSANYISKMHKGFKASSENWAWFADYLENHK